MLPCIAHGGQDPSIPALGGQMAVDPPSSASPPPKRQVKVGYQSMGLQESQRAMQAAVS